MSTRVIVSDIKEQVGYLVPTQLTFFQALNQVRERYYNSGIWDNLAARVAFPGGTDSGVINLDYAYLSLLGIAREHGTPMAIWSESQPWQEMSFGWVDPQDYTLQGVEDMGDSYPAPVDIETEGTLRIVITNAADAGKIVRLDGLYNDNADQVVDPATGYKGIELITANTTANTTQTFSTLTGVQLPENMKGRCLLYVVNEGIPTLLATYETYQSRPAYRRYKTGRTEDTIIGYCRKRLTMVKAWTDFVEPGNIGAFGMGFQALTKELAGALEEAEKFWLKGESLLQQQLKAMRGMAKPVIRTIGRQLLSGPVTSP